MNEPKKQTAEQRKKEAVNELLSATTRKHYRLPHIAELVEALFDEWNEEGLPPLKAFARSVKSEYIHAKTGSLQRTNLLAMHVRLLEIAMKTNVQNTGDLSLLSVEDLNRMGREMWADFLPRDDDDAEVGRSPDGGGSGEAAAEDPA